MEIELLSIKQASQVSGIAESTLRMYCSRGILPAAKIGKSWKIKKKSLEKLYQVNENTSAQRIYRKIHTSRMR